MLARVLLRDNEQRDAELRERLGDVRPVLLARRAVALISAVAALVIVVGWLPVGVDLAGLLVAGALITEWELAYATGARSLAVFERRLAAFAFLYATLAAALAHETADVPWIAALAFSAVLAGSGTVLRARPLAAVTAYAWVAFAVVVAGEATGILPRDALLRSGGAASGYALSGQPGAVLAFFTLAVAGVGFPTLSALTYGIARSVRAARRQARRAADELRLAEEMVSTSRDQLESWREEFDREFTRKTQELEDQNRQLAAMNAVSFALSGPMDDDGAVERASRLIARVVDARATQLYVMPTEEHRAEHALVAAEPDAVVHGLSEALMRRATEDGVPVCLPGIDGGVDEELEQFASDGEAFAIVPLVAKGRTIGAFAAIGRRPEGWDEQEVHILVMIGRDLGIALENARLYRQALDRVAQEGLLSDVVRLLGATDDAGRALTQALEMVAARIGARQAAVIARPVRSQLPQVVAHYAERGDSDDNGALSRALLAAPAMVSDRTGPLVFGEGGEIALSAGLTAQGVTTLVLVPIICADTDAEGALNALAQGDAAAGTVTQTIVAALAVVAGAGAKWSRQQIDLLGRLSNVLARRLETDALLRLQERRIRELSGLAEVAATVQATIDPERLHSGFARAVHTLIDYERLYIARLDDAGALADVACFGQGGRVLTPPAFEAGDNSHRWFGRRGIESWSASRDETPSFIDADDRHGLVVPMRPKGQVLGVVVVATREPPARQQETLITQAVEQLALALDSAALYRQATERAARIQVLGNLAAIVASVVDLREAFDGFAEEVRWLIPFDRAVMLLVDEEGGPARAYATYPERQATSWGADRVAASLAAVAIEAGGPVVLRRSDPERADFDWAALEPEMQELAAVPVSDNGVPRAVFALVRNSSQGYHAEELTALEDIASLLAVTIDRLQLYERAEHNARHDPLTGLPNLRYLNERLSRLDLEASGATAALLMVDMDDLKAFNDTLGHDVGDRVLQLLAGRLREACRAEDFLARVGGDEFVVIMENAGLEDARDVAARMHELLADAHDEIPGAPTQIRVSVGIAIAPEDGVVAQELLRAADEAMYGVKLAGGRRTGMTRREDAADPDPSRRRPDRASMDALVEMALAAAPHSEREALAIAQRYAERVALRFAIPSDGVDAMRLLAPACAADLLGETEMATLRTAALAMIEALREEWERIAPQVLTRCQEITTAAVALAWLEIAPGSGRPRVPLEEALRLLRDDPPPGVAEDVLRTLEEVARREAAGSGSDSRAA